MADPLDIFSLSASDFNAYLQEAAQYSAPSQIDFLRREYRKRNSLSGLLDTSGEADLEGKNVSSMLPIAGPAGMSLLDAAKGGKLQTRFKDYITDAIGALVGGIENPGMAAKGLLTDDEMLGAAMQTAGTAMLGGGAVVNAVRPSGDGLLASNIPDLRRQANIQRFGSDPNAPSDLSGFNAYLSKVNPNLTRIENRPNLRMGDMYGMLPENAKIVSNLGDAAIYRDPDGNFYATAFNPDLGETDVIGFVKKGENDTELHVVSEMQGKGIGAELQYLFRKENPNAPTGGLTSAGEASLLKTYNRLRDDGILTANANASVGALVLSQHARAKPALADILAQNGVDPANINAAPIQRVRDALETATARQILDPRSANAILQGFARPELEDFYANASKSAGVAGLLASDAAANAKPQLGGEVGLLGPSFVTTGPDLLAKNQARAKNDANVLAYPGLPYAGTLVQGRGILDDLEIKGFEAGDTTSARLTDIADLKGKTILPVVGDLTSDRIITSVNDITLPDPVKLQAGGQFMDKGDQLWASDKSPMSGKLSVAKQVNDPIYMHMAMGAKSGDFAKHSGAVLSEMFKAVDLSKAQMKRIAQHIRSTSVKRGDKQVTPFTDFKNFTDPSYIGEYLANLKAGGNRETFMKVLEKKTAQDLGVPDIGALRLAVTNPDLFATDFLNMGYRFGYPDVEKGLLSTDPSIHTTYDTLINKKPGTSSMTLGVDIPYTIMMRDVAEQRRSANSGGLLQGMPADYKSFEMRPSNVQKIDDQLIEEASRFKEIQQTQGRKAALDYARRLIGN